MIQQIKTKWQGEMYFIADSLGGSVDLDAAEDIGGQGKGKRPKALMLVSLAGCTGMDVALMIKKMRLEVEDFTIDVSGDLSDEHPKIYITTHVIYSFKGANLDNEKLEKAVNLSFDKYCGVIAMFKKFSVITKEVRFNY